MVYGFIRLSTHVEEPECSRIRSESKNIAKFRNMTWPMMTDRPLQIPILAQPEFTNNETVVEEAPQTTEGQRHSIPFTKMQYS